MSVSVYALKYKNETVYYGTTNNLERREKEHEQDGKIFDTIQLISTHGTAEEAKEEEKRLLTIHRQWYGRNPKYNRDSDGVEATSTNDFITNVVSIYINKLVGEIILEFVEHIKEENFPEKSIIEVTNIAHRLLGKPLIEYQPKTVYSNGKVNIILEAEVFNEKVKELLNDGYHSEAVRHAYQVVFGKLDELTGQKTPTQAFEKTNPKDILGYTPKEESKENLYEGIKSLHIAIQKFRNDIAHPLPKDIKENRDMDKNLAIHYIALASLAYRLITSNRKGV